MEILKKGTNIDFLGNRKLAYVLSGLLITASLASLAVRQLNFGIDFSGGVLVEVGYESPQELPPIRGMLEQAGFESPIVQHFGSPEDVLIRILPGAEDIDEAADSVEQAKQRSAIGERVYEILVAADSQATRRRVEFVGPRVGEELREDGGLAMVFALLMILAYVSFRFQWKFAVGAVAALAHDVIITLGVFSIFGFSFDLPVLAAVLAVIGYSLNDTIVVFDRIRENFQGIRKITTEQLMNLSINQMLSRTLVTSFTTLLVVLALFFLGGETIHNFALALIIGIVLGTYSSIYVASAIALALNVTAVDLMPPDPEIDKDLGAIP